MSHRPGMRYFPRASMTVAPAGTRVLLDAPAAAILLPRTITVWSRRGMESRPSMTVAWVKAIGVCRASTSASAISMRENAAPGSPRQVVALAARTLDLLRMSGKPKTLDEYLASLSDEQRATVE